MIQSRDPFDAHPASSSSRHARVWMGKYEGLIWIDLMEGRFVWGCMAGVGGNLQGTNSDQSSLGKAMQL